MSARSGSVVVLLPDDWDVIDLEDVEARHRAVDELVNRQFGAAPQLGGLRTSMRQELHRRVEQAARAGGLLMALAGAGGGPLTVPASLTVYRVPGSLDERGRAAMIDVLASDEPGHALDIAAGRAGTVLRRVRPARASTDLAGGQGMPSLLVDYWVEVTPGEPLAYLVFSSPLVELRDEILELFDAIVSSVGVRRQPS